MIVLIPYINLLNLSWIKMSIFEEYGAFKPSYIQNCVIMYCVIKWSLCISRALDKMVIQ